MLELSEIEKILSKFIEKHKKYCILNEPNDLGWSNQLSASIFSIHKNVSNRSSHAKDISAPKYFSKNKHMIIHRRLQGKILPFIKVAWIINNVTSKFTWCSLSNNIQANENCNDHVLCNQLVKYENNQRYIKYITLAWNIMKSNQKLTELYIEQLILCGCGFASQAIFCDKIKLGKTLIRKIIQIKNQMTTSNSNLVELFFNDTLAHYYFKTGCTEASLKCIDTAMTKCKSKAVHFNEVAVTLLHKAALLHTKRKFKHAINIVLKLLCKMDKKIETKNRRETCLSSLLWYQLSISNFHLGNLEKGFEYLNLSLQLARKSLKHAKLYLSTIESTKHIMSQYLKIL